MSLLIFVTSLTFITIEDLNSTFNSLYCMIALNIAIFAQGHPISFRTLGAGVKINRFPNTVRWNGLERQQSFDFFFSRLFCANSGKISNSLLDDFVSGGNMQERQTLRQLPCDAEEVWQKDFQLHSKGFFCKKIFNFIPKVFSAGILQTYHNYPRPTTFLRTSGYSNGK